MKNTKNNNKNSNTTKKSLNERIAELNALNKRGNDINAHLSAELDKLSAEVANRADQYRKAADTNQKQFNLLRKTINEELKFDWATGEYFPATGANGKERFHIRVRQVSEVIVAIDADSQAEAIKAAIDGVTLRPGALIAKPLTAENVSQAE